MLLNNRFLMAFGITGLATLAAIRAIRQHAQKQEKRQQKIQLNTWEGEGGNLPARPPALDPESVTRRG